MAAEEDEILLRGELIGYSLVQTLAVGGHVDDFVIFPLRLQLVDHFLHRLDHHHHPSVAAVAVVIHRGARAEAIFPDVVDVYFDQTFLDRPPHDRVGSADCPEVPERL